MHRAATAALQPDTRATAIMHPRSPDANAGAALGCNCTLRTSDHALAKVHGSIVARNDRAALRFRVRV